MEIGAVILCGGQSRRMGADKAGLEYKGETFLGRLCAVFSDYPMRLISSGEGEYKAPGWLAVADSLQGRGPMAGLCSALCAANCDALFAVSCDMPLMTAGFAAEICGRLAEDTDAVIPRTPDGICHPYCAVYRKGCAEAFRALFDAGDNCILHALDAIRACYLDVPERPELTNINTPEEYECLLSGKTPPPNRRLLQKRRRG